MSLAISILFYAFVLCGLSLPVVSVLNTRGKRN